MKSYSSLIILIVLIISFSACSHTTLTTDNLEGRENILEYRNNLEDSLILELPQIPRLCDAMDIEKRYVDIGDCKLYCEIEGTGTPMVLINGGPGDSHHIFHPWLSAASKDFQVIYYDQRGCGLSDYEPGPGYSFEQAVDDLEQLRLALHIDKWILVGHSFGGGLAQYYTIKHPENVIGQVLVASIPMVDRDEFRGGRGEKYYTKNEAEKINELRNMAIAREISMPQYLINRDLNGGWKRQYYYKPSRERIAQNALYDFIADPAYASDWAVYDFENVFIECPVPTLVFEGKYDVVWEFDRPAIMAEFHPHARIVVFETSGHNIYADEPTRFVDEIKAWFRTATSPMGPQLEKWTTSVEALIGERLILIASSKEFIALIKESGVGPAMEYYQQAKSDNPELQIFFEAPMNALGYEYLFADKIDESLEIFNLNILEYPKSWNTHDSYGEALLTAGKKKLAAEHYQISIELNPENENGKNVLKHISKADQSSSE